MIPEPFLVDRIVLGQEQLGHPDLLFDFVEFEDTELWTRCNDALQNSLLHDNAVDIKDSKPISVWVSLWRDNDRTFPWEVGRLGIDDRIGFLGDKVLVITREKLRDTGLFTHYL